MGFDLDITVPLLTVFIQGVLSFFSPCVLPLIPLYIGYFAGGAKVTDEDGTIHYPRGRVLLHTVCFVVGISATFFLLGYGFTALGGFLSGNRTLFSRLSGIIMVLFGIYQLGLLGRSATLDRELRLPFRLKLTAMGPLTALLLGFTFSFAWTPCIGPTLSSVLLMASSTSTASQAVWLIGLYTLGFVLPFLAVGLFTGQVLDFFKKNNGVVRYTVKIGAILLIFMGFMTLTGFTNGLTSYLSTLGTASTTTQQETEDTAEAAVQTGEESPSDAEEPAPAEEPDDAQETAVTPSPDFTLTDQYGVSHTLSDYQGKVVFLNFWATWCGPCQSELPDIQALYESYGENSGDVIVLGVAAPNVGQEGSSEEIAAFLADAGYTFPVVMDENYDAFLDYGISSFPTTFMIAADGSLFGYVRGALTAAMMESIVTQTLAG